jgi:hypothetical protein
MRPKLDPKASVKWLAADKPEKEAWRIWKYAYRQGTSNKFIKKLLTRMARRDAKVIDEDSPEPIVKKSYWWLRL